jgi:hypothetical protein
MNQNTRMNFLEARKELRAKGVHRTSDRVWQEYQEVEKTERFVSFMLSQRATAKEDGEHLATGFRK